MRKTVTVLFADLGGSTGFGERTDAEIARQVLARYHALLQETIDAHGGTVAKFMGDGMMATFGIPEVAEDDARRAVDAGAALQQRFAELAVDIEQRHHETLTLRVGVNTGEVVIGEGDADLVGDALNVAARLEKACRPGRVLVGEETWRLTRSAFAYEALGEVAVAGRAQPVAIHELLAAERAEEVAAPFVGREREMERLLAVLDDARIASGAKLTTILGSPGVGKTRLARELCARAAERDDARSVELRCDRAGEATFAPITQLLRDAAAIGDDADGDAVSAAIDALLPETETDRARVVDVLAALVGVGPARSVEETFWGVRRLVAATAADRPLVIVIDDIQWAEPLLLDLLEHLAEWVRDAAVLLVGLARPELRELRPALAEPGRHVAAVVVLDGLDPSATEALAAGLLGTERLPAGLVERLPSSTDGNPLFVRELVRMLVDDEVIRRRDDGEWELTIDADAVDVPPTIQSLLGARVERLPAAERQLLEYASVIGAEFSLGALRELAGAYAPIAAVPVASLLESMRRKELVEPTGTYWGDHPVHRFHHVLIRDAAYRRLLKTARAELHERVAEWTDRTAADMVGEHEAAIAFHYEQAHRYRSELGTVDDDTERLGRRAAELLTIGAQRALGRDDLASAGALSARALALLPETDTAARSDLLMMGCECLLAAADGAAARPLVEELGRSAADDPRLAAWADCYAAQLVGLTDPEGLVAADAQAQAAAAALTELGDGSGQAKAHQVRASLLARLGRVGDAEQELDLALAAARTADDRRRVTAVLGAAPDAALFGPSPVARAGGRCLDVVRLLRITTASPAVEAASNRCQAVLEALRGRFDVARSMLASARAALEELGLRHGLAQTEQYAGMVELIAGDPHAAIPHLRAAFGGLGALGVGADAGNAAALLARALLIDGNVDEADEMATASEQLAGQNLKTAIGWRVARAEVLAAHGELDAAVAIVEQAVEIAAGTDLVVDHADACAALATLRARAGDAAGAASARADAKRLYEQKGATVPAERLADEHPAVSAPTTPSPPEPSTGAPRIENTATRSMDQFPVLARAQRFDAMTDLIAADYIRIDHRRGMPAPTARGPHDFVELIRATLDVGFDEIRNTPVAVRGERVALSRVDVHASDGREISFLQVHEWDGSKLVYAAHFDEDELDAALDELDARYLDGEGVDHAPLIRQYSSACRALAERDFEVVRSLFSPGFVLADHRELEGHFATDLEGIIDIQRAYADVSMTIFARTVQVEDRRMLATSDFRGVDPHGTEVVWVYQHVIVFDAANLVTRLEMFDERDWAAAKARFDELAEDSQGLRIENVATRSMKRLIELLLAGDFDQAGELIAEGITRVDRRSMIPAPLANGRDEYLASTRAIFAAGFSDIFYVPIAVRGDRLALARGGLRSGGGDESEFLQLEEVDETGRLAHMMNFDADDLGAAIGELDARYAAGEGAAHADLIATNRAWFRAMYTRDREATRSLAAPGFEFVDRRPIGAPSLDLGGFIAWQDGYGDVAGVFVAVDTRFRERASLVTLLIRAIDPGGGEIAWPMFSVGVFDGDARARRIEIFAPEQWDAALARFDELAAAPQSGPAAESTATRALIDGVRLVNERDSEGLRALLAPGFEVTDRRSVVAGPSGNREDFIAAVMDAMEMFEAFAADALVATRGDRLVLSRCRFVGDGFDVRFLHLMETDGHGVGAAVVMFDEDDLAAAVADLDARYAAGEGAAHASVIQLASDFVRSMAALDGEARLALVHPDARFTDHRRLGYGSMGFDGVRGLLMTRGEQLVEDTSYFADLTVRGDTMMGLFVSVGTGPDGADVLYEGHWVTRWVAGTMLEIDWYDPDDIDTARARFDELSAADPRTLEIENTATAVTLQVVRLLDEGRMEEVRALLHQDLVVESRRWHSGAPQPVDVYVDSLRVMREQYDSFASECMAIRGDRLQVVRLRANDDAGNELDAAVATEVDESGRIIRLVNFDGNDEIAAIDLLDEWYVEGEGAAGADVLRAGRELLRTYHARDWTDLRDRMAPDFEFVDHRPLPLPWPLSDADGLIRLMQERVEQVSDLRSRIRKLWVQGRAGLSVGEAIGTDEQGGLQRWPLLTVQALDTAGKTRRIEYFAPEQLDGALARLDELAAGAVDPRHPWIENAATRILPRFTALFEAGHRDAAAAGFAEDFRRIDRRTTVSFPDMGKAEYLDWHQSAYEHFDTITIQSLAIRGEQLCLLRVVLARDGFESVFVMLVQLDDEGLIAECVNFDEDDLATAQDELDARFLAGEGAPHAPILRTARAFVAAMLAGDGDGVVRLMRPDMAFADHRRFGIEGGAAGFLPHYAGYGDIQQSVLVTKYVLATDVLLAGSLIAGVDDRGSEVVWPFHVVSAFDGDARYRSSDFYDAEDWDTALARFDELAAAGAVDARHPWIENAATRILPRFTALFEAERFDQTEALLAEDFRRVDRRSTVSSRDIGKAEYLEWHKSLYEIFDTVTFQPLAVRGERLGLVRITAARDGFQTVSVALARLDEAGLIVELVHFDDADLAAAQDELDARFLAGEGAPYGELLRGGKALAEAYVAHDTAAVATMRAPGYTFADHRRFGWEGPEAIAAFDDLDESFLVTKYLLRSNAMLASVVNRGIDPRGNDAEWLLHVVTAVDGERRFSITDWYDADDWEAALARFDELASVPADPRHPRAENAVTRRNDRFVMLVEAGRTAEAGMVADDYVRVDRRSTVAAPDSSGSGEYADSLAAALDVGFTSYRVMPIAVRGERLALSRVVMTTDDGFDLRFLVFDESGDDGRARRSVYFDDDDLVTAVEALELRHRELSGDAYSEVERASVDKILAVNATQVDGLVQCDVTRYVSPRAVLSVQPIRGAPPGSDVDRRSITVECFDRDGLVAADHHFEIEQWDEALALFDEWSAAVVPAAEPAVVFENSAVRALVRLSDAFAARDEDRVAALYPDDAVNEDRRTGVNSGVSVGRDAIAELRRGLEGVGFTSVVHEVLAVRGEHLALARRCFTGTAGFDLELLTVVEVDADERHAMTVLFDVDDLDAAQQELDARYLARGGAAPE